MNRSVSIKILLVASLMPASCKNKPDEVEQARAQTPPKTPPSPSADPATVEPVVPRATGSATPVNPRTGDLSKVAGIKNTYRIDKKLAGTPLTLTALYVKSSATTANGKVTYDVVLSDTKGDLDTTISCLGDAEIQGLTQWDTVTVSGVVGDRLNEAALEHCKVTKLP